MIRSVVLQEFLISPVQLGIPYSRPRYFALMQHTPDQGGSPFPLQARIFFPPSVSKLVPFFCLGIGVQTHSCRLLSLANHRRSLVVRQNSTLRVRYPIADCTLLHFMHYKFDLESCTIWQNLLIAAAQNQTNCSKSQPSFSCSINYDLMAALHQQHICCAFKHRTPEIEKSCAAG